MKDIAYFSEDVEFKGTLCFEKNMEINGKFEGEIIAEGKLIVGESALIKADIVAPAIIVKGKVQGNLVARDRVELHSGAHLYGDVKTPQFVLSEGVTFVGSSDTLEGNKPATDFSSMFSRLGKSLTRESRKGSLGGGSGSSGNGDSGT